VSHHPPKGVILLVSAGSQQPDISGIKKALSFLTLAAADIPVVVVSDAVDFDFALDVLRSGARGYIPTSIALDVAIEAIHLVEAGGTFLPAEGLLSMALKNGSTATSRELCGRAFTTRQAEVVQAIQHGMANKQIAYKLKLSESTVKAHIRTIMRKLKVNNRTALALHAKNLAE
jgi:DNA-binding NarL/FixJ family response regulator